jgi:hypothetical protein
VNPGKATREQNYTRDGEFRYRSVAGPLMSGEVQGRRRAAYRPSFLEDFDDLVSACPRGREVSLGWPFGRKTSQAEPPSALSRSAIPRDAERVGPAPPPLPTAQRPGLSFHSFRGPFVTAGAAPQRVVRIEAGEQLPPIGGGSSLLVLSGALHPEDGSSSLAPGDILVSMDAQGTRYRNDSFEPAFLLMDAASTVESHTAEPGGEPRRIARDDLVGQPFAGVTGIRALARNRSGVAVRLGPPPGARWVIVGLRSMAVFVGKMTLIENDESYDVTAGNLVLVSDPTATLYVQAGNDAAVAVGFAETGVVVALG